MRALEQKTLDWVRPYWNAHHLVRARDWLLELDPEAGEAARLAALTHDMERHFPGGPVNELTEAPEEALQYRREHSARSASIVGDWLREQGAAPKLVEEVKELIRLHEVGGSPAADLVQAADSISFLETNVDTTLRWVEEGRCDLARARDQHRWMYERIRLARAKEIARPFYERALAEMDGA